MMTMMDSNDKGVFWQPRS